MYSLCVYVSAFVWIIFIFNFRYENGEQEHCLELWNRDGKVKYFQFLAQENNFLFNLRVSDGMIHHVPLKLSSFVKFKVWFKLQD